MTAGITYLSGAVIVGTPGADNPDEGSDPGDGGMNAGAGGAAAETPFTLSQPGRLIAVLEECMARRIRPDRSGWSAARHLGMDLERHFGVRAPQSAIERALRTLARRHRLRLKVDAGGILWYRIEDDR
jgi:hypothetical protein